MYPRVYTKRKKRNRKKDKMAKASRKANRTKDWGSQK